MARDYAKVSPRFWTGDTGKKLRTNRSAQVLATYLISAPGSTMTGIYYLPLPIISHETGMTMPEVLDALLFLASIDFAHYDGVAELVWVPAMASWQIGASLKPNDNQVKGIRRELAAFNNHEFVHQFWERYGEAFSLGPSTLVRGARPPSKALRSQEHDQDQEQEQEHSGGVAPARDPIAPAPVAPAPPAAQYLDLPKMFGRVRHAVLGAGTEFQSVRMGQEAIRATSILAEEIRAAGEVTHVEPAMRLFFGRVKSGEYHGLENDTPKAFGRWRVAWPNLRDEVTGDAAKVAAPAARGSPGRQPSTATRDAFKSILTATGDPP